MLGRSDGEACDGYCCDGHMVMFPLSFAASHDAQHSQRLFPESEVGIVRDNAKQLKFKAGSTGFEE